MVLIVSPKIKLLVKEFLMNNVTVSDINIHDKSQTHYHNTTSTLIDKSLMAVRSNLVHLYTIHEMVLGTNLVAKTKVEQLCALVDGLWLMRQIKLRTTQRQFDNLMAIWELDEIGYPEACIGVYLKLGLHPFDKPYDTECDIVELVRPILVMTHLNHEEVIGRPQEYSQHLIYTKRVLLHNRVIVLSGLIIDDLVEAIEQPNFIETIACGDPDGLVTYVTGFARMIWEEPTSWITTRFFLRLLESRLKVELDTEDTLKQLYSKLI